MIIDKITGKDNEPKIRKALLSLVTLTQLSDMNLVCISEFYRLKIMGEELLRMDAEWKKGKEVDR